MCDVNVTSMHPCFGAHLFALTLHGMCCAPQIVTHLCYSDFEEIMGAIDGLDGEFCRVEYQFMMS